MTKIAARLIRRHLPDFDNPTVLDRVWVNGTSLALAISAWAAVYSSTQLIILK